MTPEQKTRLLIGSLVTAVIIVVVYGLFKEMNPARVPVAEPTAQETAPAPLLPEPSPSAPIMRLQADNQVIANTSGHQASITTDSDLAYEWTIQGGTIEGTSTNPAITWTAGTGSETVLTCKGTNAADLATIVTKKVILRQPPTISQFEAEPMVITLGSSSKISWNAKDTQNLTLEPGGQDVSNNNGPAVEVKPEKTTVYTLKASNSTGIIAVREIQVKVIPPPEIISFRADPVAASTTAFTVIGEFKAGRAQLKNGSQVVASGDASPLSVQMAELKEGASLVLTVTNEAGTYVASTLKFSAKKP